MSTDPSKNVHIYLQSAEEKEKVFAKPDGQYDRYIILMNDTLQSENRELREKMNGMTMELSVLGEQAEEFEDDLGRQEKGHMYVKGLLKNFVELDKMRTEEALINATVQTGLLKSVRTYKLETQKELQIVAAAVMAVFVGVVLLGYWYNAVFFGVLSCVDIYTKYMNVTTFVLGEYKDENQRLKVLRGDMKIITDAQDFIHDHMDSL
jgi:hypothetical protein